MILSDVLKTKGEHSEGTLESPHLNRADIFSRSYLKGGNASPHKPQT